MNYTVFLQMLNNMYNHNVIGGNPHAICSVVSGRDAGISSEKAQEAANKIKENSSVIAIGDSIIVSVENNEISEVIKRLADYNIIGVERKTL